MRTNDTATERSTARHERRLETARRLLDAAEPGPDADGAVLTDCQSTLARPRYQRSRSQAALDATSVILSLADADVDCRRVREARQLLVAVQGGQHDA